jgi:hypothetical protein
VPVHGALAEHEPGRDRPVRLAGGDEAQHLDLARRQPVAGGGRVEARKVGRRAEGGERAAGRVALERGAVLVA